MAFLFLCASNHEFVLTATLHFALLAGLDDFSITRLLGVSDVLVLKQNVNDLIYDFCFTFKLFPPSLHDDMFMEKMFLCQPLSQSFCILQGNGLGYRSFEVVGYQQVLKTITGILFGNCFGMLCLKKMWRKEGCFNADFIGLEQTMLEGNWNGKSHFVGPSLQLLVE